MDSGLTITVGPDKFSEKDADEKLELIYQAVTSQQCICMETVKAFRKKFDIYDRTKENSKDLPMRTRKSDFKVVAGTGAVGGYSVSELIDLIKTYISGG